MEVEMYCACAISECGRLEPLYSTNDFRDAVSASGFLTYIIEKVGAGKVEDIACLKFGGFEVVEVESSPYYMHDFKEWYLHAMKSYLGQVARRIFSDRSKYEIRVSAGGPAVLGDVILHADRLYLTVGGSSFGEFNRCMYRSCKGRKDYVGGHNRFIAVDRLLDDTVIDELRRIAKGD